MYFLDYHNKFSQQWDKYCKTLDFESRADLGIAIQNQSIRSQRQLSKKSKKTIGQGKKTKKTKKLKKDK